MFKDECIISYLFKKINDPNYELGKTIKVDDFEFILGTHISDIMINYYIPLMYIINFAFIVCLGNINNIIKGFMILSVISYCMYIYSVKSNMSNQNRQIIRKIHSVIITIFLGVTLYMYIPKKYLKNVT